MDELRHTHYLFVSEEADDTYGEDNTRFIYKGQKIDSYGAAKRIPFLPAKHAAAYIGFSETTLRIWRCRKKSKSHLPYTDLKPIKQRNGRILYPLSELDAFNKAKLQL